MIVRICVALCALAAFVAAIAPANGGGDGGGTRAASLYRYTVHGVDVVSKYKQSEVHLPPTESVNITWWYTEREDWIREEANVQQLPLELVRKAFDPQGSHFRTPNGEHSDDENTLWHVQARAWRRQQVRNDATLEDVAHTPREKLLEKHAGFAVPHESVSACGHVHEYPRVDSLKIKQNSTKRDLFTAASAYPCSTTICDFPDVQAAYLEQLGSGGNVQDVTIKAFAVTFKSGALRHATAADTTAQAAALTRWYATTKMTFSLQHIAIERPSVWSKLLLAEDISQPNSIFQTCQRGGDPDACDADCNYEVFGWDMAKCLCANQGPNCDDSDGKCRCLKDNNGNYGNNAFCLNGDGKNNNVCDPICNHPAFDWDHGQCCFAGSNNCFDPDSNMQSFDLLGDIMNEIDNLADLERQGPVFLAHEWANYGSKLGVAGSPWAYKGAEGRAPGRGHIVINTWTNCWGNYPADDAKKQPARTGTTAVHELGHTFGLLHTFAGVQRQSGGNTVPKFKTDICDLSCVETGDRKANGDFCADTPPTSVNYKCEDPCVCGTENCRNQFCSDCSNRPWTNTQFENVMGYAADECVDRSGLFSPQQTARMRCYFDLTFRQDWFSLGAAPGEVVVPPKASAGGHPSEPSLMIEWMMPVHFGSGGQVTFELERRELGQTTAGLVISPAGTAASNQWGNGKEYGPLYPEDARPWFGQYVDHASLSPSVAYQYRVRAKNVNGTAAWSPWGDAVNPTVASPCPNNCYGHGTCTASGCECADGWGGSARNPYGGFKDVDGANVVNNCYLEEECRPGCPLSFKDDGLCTMSCNKTPQCNGFDDLELCALESVDPRCSTEANCPDDLLGNGVCNSACRNELCVDSLNRIDFGDCEGCTTECPTRNVGNGICNPECNTLGACDKDGGDCEVRTCNWVSGEQYTGGAKCLKFHIGDGECQPQCDSAACDYDGGDCGADTGANRCAPGCADDMIDNNNCDRECQGVSFDGRRALCHGASAAVANDPALLLIDGGDCDGCATGCTLAQVGDGNCDSACGTPECRLDLNDCGSCICYKGWLGDGVCDEPCKGKGCNYDEGDCALVSVDSLFGTPIGIGITVGLSIMLCCILFVLCPIILMACWFKFFRLPALRAHALLAKEETKRAERRAAGALDEADDYAMGKRSVSISKGLHYGGDPNRRQSRRNLIVDNTAGMLQRPGDGVPQQGHSAGSTAGYANQGGSWNSPSQFGGGGGGTGGSLNANAQYYSQAGGGGGW